MTAEQAMAASPACLIKAEVGNGIVTIYRSAGAAHEGFEVRFVPRAGDGQLDMSGMTLLGSFPSLSAAERTAAKRHGFVPGKWRAERPAELFEDRSTGTLQVRAPQAHNRSQS